MPFAEESERVGGAALLGVPAFDAFVWALDNYARIELLVRLHEHLPPFILSPVTSFVCMCVGLYLLHLSHQKHLKRMTPQPSARALVDTSGMELRALEKPRWVLPVVLVFLLALVATPILAIAYSLTDKGPSAPALAIPRPPLFAYFKTPNPTPQRTIPPPAVQAPYGIAIGGGNVTNPTVNNNFAPLSRSINPRDRLELVRSLSQTKGTGLVVYPVSDNEAANFAQVIYDILSDAGWNMREQAPRPIMPQGKFPSGLRIGFHGEVRRDGEMIDIDDRTLEGKVIAAFSSAHVKNLYVNTRPELAEGTIEFLVTSNPDATQQVQPVGP